MYVNKILHPFLTSAEPTASPSTISLPESSTALPFHAQSPDTATHRSAKQRYCIKYVHNNSKKWDGRRLWLDGAWLEELYPAEELLPGKAITLPWHKKGGEVSYWSAVVVEDSATSPPQPPTATAKKRKDNATSPPQPPTATAKKRKESTTSPPQPPTATAKKRKEKSVKTKARKTAKMTEHSKEKMEADEGDEQSKEKKQVGKKKEKTKTG